jgi:hypothetical protein
MKRIIFIPGTSSGNTLLTDLEAYWKLDETSGTRFDSTANNNDLTDNNTVGNTTGKIGNAASFVAANNERLSLSNSTPLDPGSSDFSFAVWLKTTSIVVNNILGAYTGSSAPGYALSMNTGGEIYIYFSDGTNGGFFLGSGSGYGSGYNDGNWHFVVVNFDRSGNLEIFADNVSIGSDSISTIGAVTPATAFSLGTRGSASTGDYTGDLDEVYWRIGSILNSSDRAALWNSGAGLTYPF